MFTYIEKYKIRIVLLLTISFLILFFIFNHFHNLSHSKTREVNNLAYNIDFQSVKLLKSSLQLTEVSINENTSYWYSIDSILNKSKFSGYIYSEDSLIYWNNSTLNPAYLPVFLTDTEVHIINLPSGWYLYTGRKIGNNSYYVFDLIKSDYVMNNHLLPHGFITKYSNSKNLNLTLAKNESEFTINNIAGKFLVGLNFENEKNFNAHTSLTIFILFIVCYILFAISIFVLLNENRYLKKNNIFAFSFYIISISVLWILIYVSGFPTELKSTSFFTSLNTLIPFTDSYGDLIINLVPLTIYAIAAFIFLGNRNTKLTPTVIILKYTLLWVYLLILMYVLYNSIQIQDINLFSESTFINGNIFITLLVVILLNASLYLSISSYLNPDRSNKISIAIPILISAIGLFIIYVLLNIHAFIIIITYALFIIVINIKYYLWSRISDVFLKNILLLVIFSVVTAVIVNYSIYQKQDKDQKYIIETLAKPSDNIFVKEYRKIIPSLLIDNNLKSLVYNDSIIGEDEIKQYLKQHFFKGHFNNYSIQITNCGPNELIEIQPEGEVYDCNDYFSTLITDFTLPVIDSLLYQFNSKTEGHYYLGLLNIIDPQNHHKTRNLFIEFISSHVPEGLGYPELLVDSETQKLNLAEFSFAIYQDGLLSYKFGDYAYSTSLSTIEDIELNNWFNYKNNRHYIKEIAIDSYIIVSRKEYSITMNIVIFSLTFIILSLLGIIIYLIAYARKALDLFRYNFKTRLQTFVIATLTTTFILIAVSTLYYIKESSKEEMEKQLSEKTNSVLIELQHKLSNVSNLESEDREFLHQLLRKFSLVFFSDINLYNKSGVLIATSRPEIFEKNLLSPTINPNAYKAIFIGNELNYITEETIGALSYYSSYVPLNLNSYYPVGIVNLPYFARQSEYTKSYYIMLSYLINIYVIIGILGALIAIIFSKYLTRPLVLLKESISTIRIDKHNERISWNKNDEIGLLINEYNRMVDKLEQSADLLKHSERESAWREVAKQIAHEIKNPLTPMKLNVQYLEKSYKNNDPEFPAKIDSISKSLITQIDILDNVAEMFSNFAKTKSLDFEEVDLKKIITTSVDLFNKNKNVKFNVDTSEITNLITLGFEKDILRVINNILKNAMQAVESKNPGIITISLNNEDRFIELSVSDNGKGISEEMKSSIFQPYFTTKSSGTGLGLAIVKNIMNEIGGEVYFKSSPDNGTTFYLRFPIKTK